MSRHPDSKHPHHTNVTCSIRDEELREFQINIDVYQYRSPIKAETFFFGAKRVTRRELSLPCRSNWGDLNDNCLESETEGKALIAIIRHRPIPLETESKSLIAITCHRPIPPETENKALITITCHRPIPPETESKALIVITFHRPIPLETESKALIAITFHRPIPPETESKALIVITCHRPIPLETESKALIAITCHRPIPPPGGTFRHRRGANTTSQHLCSH
ncbi:hypothetical protein AVEN_109735-1 [Araneus ventricosus]|uniref:Uncharacterized protein n=1 Tax=Araneus ventricosus TaxID=182803 RepID=A0A4Y2KZ62_ARAVE|nr:hypothetical protein AVEN_109735-1 [Araneus ventricosus]